MKALSGGIAGALVALSAVGLARVGGSPADRREPVYTWRESVSTSVRDDDLGIRYLPGVVSRVQFFRDGVQVYETTSRINRYGRIGRDVERAELLVAGDSFSANPIDGGITWTDYYSEPCVNVAVSGYGVLAMSHRAARERHPRTMLVFISDDLTRARWHYGDAELRRGIPRHALVDFRSDEQFVQDANLLNVASTTIVRIPDWAEMQNGEYRDGDRTQRLIQSWRQSMPNARYVSIDPSAIRMQKNDWTWAQHPSASGARKYADAIVDAMGEVTQ